jgi:putative ABC transport system ATP-binding protein
MSESIRPHRRQPIVSVIGLTRTFLAAQQNILAIDDVTLDIFPQEFVAVTGRSGSGKTTLLNLMAGLDRPTSGTVLIDGLNINTIPESDLVELRRRSIGFVFQSFGLMPLLSAQENVELPLHINGVPWRERRRRASESLDTVGLGSRSQHRPYELSGGEQQRVSIARALVTNPSVIFADEPTGELDNITAISIGSTLQGIVTNYGVTMVVATHDITLSRMASRRIDLSDGTMTELESTV